MATSSKPKGAKQPHRNFAFDLHKPLFKGNLLKQGEFHRAFKDRFFVLYPGFLVYYDTVTTWQYDLQRGETLGGRLNALKLKGGSVDKAKNPPKHAKYAFVLQSPDPSNKRRVVMFNAKSSEERYQWMVKIRLAIPGKPKTADEQKITPLEEKPLEEKKEEKLLEEEKPLEEKKEEKPFEEKKEEKPLEEKKEEVPLEEKKEEVPLEEKKEEKPLEEKKEEKPLEEKKEEKPLEEKKEEVPLDEEPIEEQKELISEPPKPADTPVIKEESIQDPVFPSPDPVVEHDDKSTDNVLGPREHITSTSSMGSAIYLSSPSDTPERETDSSTKDETDSSPNPEDSIVVSSVSVEVNQDHRDTTKILPKSDSLDVPLSGDGDGIKRDSTLRIVETTETVIPAQNSPRLSITIASSSPDFDYDSDSDNDSDGVVELPEELPYSPIKDSKKGSTSSDTKEPVSSSPSSTPPTISIDTVEDDPVTKKEEPFASPTPDRRRPSGIAGFIEKRGYLYKMGGKYKTWHLRYFVLQPGMLKYYKNDPKGKVLGEVKLSKRTRIQFPKTADKKYSTFQFTIYSPSDWNKRSTYAIAANNDREMKEWIEAFKLASGILKESPEHVAS